jgi:hypothetical protein
MNWTVCLLAVAALPALSQTRLSESFTAFQQIAVVLRHPRCLNCHIPGDAPITESGQPHPMGVKRGPDGKGAAVLHCSACHQETNGEQPHSPPGSKDWQLPPAATRMAWVGLNDRQLCRALLDGKTNGGMTREPIVEHMRSDPRVAWAWNPGLGREASMAHEKFVEMVRTWIEKGGACE